MICTTLRIVSAEPETGTAGTIRYTVSLNHPESGPLTLTNIRSHCTPPTSTDEYLAAPEGSVWPAVLLKGDSLQALIAEQKPGGPSSDWYSISAATPNGANRWRYTASRVYKDENGYRGWLPDESGSYTLFNGFEDPNGAAGVQGNGVNVANLEGTFALRPITAGVVVRGWKVPVGDLGDMFEYWFFAPNGVDGECGGDEE